MFSSSSLSSSSSPLGLEERGALPCFSLPRNQGGAETHRQAIVLRLHPRNTCHPVGGLACPPSASPKDFEIGSLLHKRKALSSISGSPAD